RLAFFKVTFHCITNLAPQRLHGFRFSENGMTQGASSISAFRRFFDEEDNFVHLVRASSPLMLPRISTIRRSFSRILSASCSGGKCVMSSLARGFFRIEDPKRERLRTWF